MAIRPLNSVAGFSVGETPSNVILANGDITTTNITTTGVSNLNAIGNVKITGGSSGQAITTDGLGNLVFTTIASGTLSNGTSNVTVLNSANITFSSAGNANIMVITGTGVNVAGTFNTGSGNANVGNLGTAQVLATANITTPQVIANIAQGTAPFLVNSNTVVANLNADLLDGFNTATANTASTVAVRDTNGNLSANFFIGNGSQLTGIGSAGSIANGSSNVSIPAVNGNVNTSVGGTANVLVVTTTGANILGTLNTGTGNANVGNLGTAQVLASANVTAPQLISNVTSGTAPLVVTSTTRVANLSVAYANVSDFDVVTTQTTGVYYPTFVNAGTTANYALASNTAFTANLANGALLATTFVGNLSGVFANGNSNVNIPAANGNVNISAVGNANILVVTGTGVNVFGTLNTGTGNANVGNIGATTAIFTTGNITTVNSGLVQNGTSNVTITSGANISSFIGGNATAQFVVTATGVNVAGTLNAVGNANVGNIGAATAIFTTGNITTVNSGLLQNGTSNVTIASGGNVSVFTAGNATAQLILTSTGANIGGTANVVGNANVGNLGTAGVIVASGNITSSANLISDNILGRTGALTITSAGTNTNINLKPNGTGNIDANATYITNVKDPFSNQDAATKAYVDTKVSTGIAYHQPVYVATTTTLATDTGGTTAYNSPNGAANGIGAYISTTGTFLNIDGFNIQTVGRRILVKNEANAAWNGVYTYSNTTAITRSTDTDEYGPDSTEQLSVNDYFFTQNGNVNEGVSWIVASPAGTITFGTSNIVFSEFSTSQVYNAGTGLTLANTTFSISNTTVTSGSYGNGDAVATFTVNSQGQLTAASNTAITANAANLTGTTLNASIVTSSLTTVGTLGSLAVTGNVTAGNFVGRLANGNSNVNIPTANGNVNITAVGNATFVVTGTGANITGTLNATGNANVGNLGTAQVLATANVTAPQLISNVATSTAPLVVTSTTRVANLSVAYANVSDFGVVTTQSSGVYYPTFVSAGTTANYALASNTSITANLANSALIATTFVGNVSGNITGALANGTSNVNIPTASGNVNISAGGTANVIIATSTGANVTGTANVSGNLSAGNISATNGNLSVANVSGNIILGNSTVTTTMTWASVTTTAVTANQTIASFSVTGVTGVEFLVKGVDATGSKYSVATVHAVTDGTNVDYSTFGGVTLGAYTGSLAVNISGGFIRLQVTPASSNSTVWTTQYRLV